MTFAFFLTFALLTTPIALIKRKNIDPTTRSTVTIIEYLLYKVAWTGAILAGIVLTGIFIAVIFTEGNPSVYIGPLAAFTLNTGLAIVAGALLPWLTLLAVTAVRFRRSRSA